MELKINPVTDKRIDFGGASVLYFRERNKRERRILMIYTDLIFDLYGTLVDIHTEEDDAVWEKTAIYSVLV